MTRSTDGHSPQRLLADGPAPLAEYADRLLLSTGLHAEDALAIASGQFDPPAELEPLARALRAGWDSENLA